MHSISAEDRMADRPDQVNATPNYDETRHPDNPPNSVLNKSARRSALFSSVGTLVALFVVVALALAYWSVRQPSAPERPDRDRAVGTSGDTTPGGGDPEPHPSSTSEELKVRGGINTPAQGPMPNLHDRTPITRVEDTLQKANDVAGRPVDLDNVIVDRMQGDTFWVRDGNDAVQVVAAPGISLQKGARVRVIGVMEAAGSTARVRASKVETR
jgi:hypothetical protein